MGLSHLLNVLSGAAVSTHPDILFDSEVKEYRLLAHHACAEKSHYITTRLGSLTAVPRPLLPVPHPPSGQQS